jgi:hypothetical protein
VLSAHRSTVLPMFAFRTSNTAFMTLWELAASVLSIGM